MYTLDFAEFFVRSSEFGSLRSLPVLQTQPLPTWVLSRTKLCYPSSSLLSFLLLFTPLSLSHFPALTSVPFNLLSVLSHSFHTQRRATRSFSHTIQSQLRIRNLIEHFAVCFFSMPSSSLFACATLRNLRWAISFGVFLQNQIVLTPLHQLLSLSLLFSRIHRVSSTPGLDSDLFDALSTPSY